MKEHCREYRETWSGEAHGAPHVEACESCRAWLRAVLAHGEALSALAPVPAPPELGERVRAELEEGAEGRVRRALLELTPLTAPEELTARLELESEEHWQRLARTLGTLDWLAAPAVLDRLVSEELEDAPAHRSRRFCDLERLDAPHDLERRVERGLTRQQRRWRMLAGSAATAAAAALLLWGGLRGAETGAERDYPFEVVRTGDLAGLDPIARALGGGLSGGLGRAVNASPTLREAARQGRWTGEGG